MGIDEAVRLMRHVDAVRRAPTDLVSIAQATSEVSRLRAWLDGCEAELAAAFVGRSPMPTRDLAAARRTSERAADRVIERADTASSVPELGAAMAAGEISGAHVDAVTAGIKSLEPEQRSALRDRAGQLAAKASTSTVEEFQALIRAEARRIMDDDGIARLERQKRACRLRTWISREDGMWRISGTFDPETGLRLSGRLDNAVAALFAEATPESAPTDPGERADHLRALALVALTEGRAGSSGRSEIVAVVHEHEPQQASNTADRGSTADPVNVRSGDNFGVRNGAHGRTGTENFASSDGTPAPARAASATAVPRVGSPGGGSLVSNDDSCAADNEPATTDGWAEPNHAQTQPVDDRSRSAPYIDWGLPVELPWDVLTRMITSGEADVHAVVVRNGIVIHAPGQLDLGRTTRLASKAQRRALRVMYPTCAVPGCCVRFQYTSAHHVIWWERGGRTDLGNLLPLCSRHHHLVHEGGWHLNLDDQRILTVTLPDGTQLSNAPPQHHRKAAA
jgi:Domain of unknown function (DUF222)